MAVNLRQGHCPGLLDGLNVITWVLIGGRQEAQSQEQERGRQKQRLERLGPGARGCRWPLEAGRGKEPPEKRTLLLTLIFSPGRLISEFWSPEL